MRNILDLFRGRPSTRSIVEEGAIIEQGTNHSGNTLEKEQKIQETSQKGIVDTILEELESNSGETVNLLKLGDALLDMSIAISAGLEGEESIAKNIERIRQRWKKEIEMAKNPSQSEIAAVAYFHRDVIAISELKGKPDCSYTFYVPELGGITRIHFFNKQGKIIIYFNKFSCSDPIQQSNFDQLIAQSQIYQSRNNPNQNADKNSS